jgi:hypothetical protein
VDRLLHGGDVVGPEVRLEIVQQRVQVSIHRKWNMTR